MNCNITSKGRFHQEKGNEHIILGYGKFSARQVLAKLSPGLSEEAPAEEPASKPSTLGTVMRRVFGQSADGGAIKVKGYNDLLVYRARCCNKTSASGLDSPSRPSARCCEGSKSSVS